MEREEAREMKKADFEKLTLEEAIEAFFWFLEGLSYFTKIEARAGRNGGYIVNIKVEDYRKKKATINSKEDLLKYLKRNDITDEFFDALEEAEREDLKYYSNYFKN